MREFTNPTYDGPDCVCCKPKSIISTSKTAKAYARGVSDTKNQMVDILMDEKSRWGSGTFVDRLMEQLIERVKIGK